MKKIAFFVEGQTEMMFVHNFLRDYLQGKSIKFDKYKIRKNKIIVIQCERIGEDEEYNISIFDVGNDEGVFGAVSERSEQLITQHGYSYIFGIRDLYPGKIENLEGMIQRFANMAKSKNLEENTYYAIAVQELEGWFFLDHHCICRYNDRVPTEEIIQRLGDGLNFPEQIAHPASLLNSILSKYGSGYDKKKSECHGITNAIDFNILVGNMKKSPSFEKLLSKIDKIC